MGIDIVLASQAVMVGLIKDQVSSPSDGAKLASEPVVAMLT